ncbi:type I methionyl aminopeptidase [Nonomuraea roseoviolacea subsp. roseoviolacea]|uniref:Methionine aminopeptidase n=1 Tax=Nonomuraea roseoviolacea subsp. carminata TaxID=160689 RepID=A0ABT1KD75_9ACTN|nr:type I methionyl aminopeptidase [Nonomuraea roseoviolacea]MCP2351974.1 methionyl aminopeptidase [Nonomuraea roseoviolacea subsp. carminata]
MVEIKTPAELDAMREAGRVVGRTIQALTRHAAPGVRLDELDELAATLIAEAGATPAFLGYHPPFAPTPYPAVVSTSVNDVIVHGIPTRYRLREGDVLSIDCGAYLDGWAGDSATTITIGPPAPADATLIDTTRRALDNAIAAAIPGNRIGDISHAIASTAQAAGYGYPLDFGGHGIGRHMHEDPHVANHGRPGRGLPLRPGLVLALEPMFIAGGAHRYRTAPDGWSLTTHDRSRAAHAEHTVAITDDGPRILTLP